MIDDVDKLLPPEVDGVEGWQRLTDEPNIRGVETIRLADQGPWQWQVIICAMEFLREDPLEASFRNAMAAKLRSVSGVTDVAEQDREIWIVDGSPSGRDLTIAAASVADQFADVARKFYEKL